MQNGSARAPAADLAVIIPAYRPGRVLIDVASELARLGFNQIVIVDDGSGPEFNPVFELLSGISGVELVRHQENQGKGAALKTGIAHALREWPDLAGVVTADADGQHRPEDIRRVAGALLEHPDALVLGSRIFEGDVPLRSRFGNQLTRQVVRLFVGENLKDTQTGLRAIPARFAASLAALTSTGYDFELDMLIAARNASVPIIEEPIKTIYEPGNQSSHFHPLLDSMKIYAVLFRFCSVALMTALLDNVVFYLAYRHGAGLLAAQAAGRGAAVVFNYLLVRQSVFHARDRHAVAIPKYLALVAASGSVSYALIRLATHALPIPVLAAKVAIESLLFFVNFSVERDWIFVQTARRSSKSLAAILLWLLLLVPAVVEVVCFHNAHLLSQGLWSPTGLHHLQRYAVEFAAFYLVSVLLVRSYLVPVSIAAILILSTLAVGPLPVAAVLLFVFSSTVLGRLVFGQALEARLAFLAGVALWVFGISLTARLPVHYRGTYLVALLLPVAAGYRQSVRLAAEWRDCFRPGRLHSIPEFAAFALLAFVAAAHWLVVLEPEVSTDGLAMHLAIPFEMARRHAFTLDFRHYTWALMPMGADWCYTVVYLLSGEYAARLLNFVMLAALALLLFRALREYAPLALAIFLTAVFLSTPLVQLVTGSLFVENFVAAMILAGVTALWRFQQTRMVRYLLLSALLLGTSVALKLGAIALVLFALPFLFGAARESPRLATGAAAGILLITAAVPYANAYWRSGSPIYPFANEKFHSRYVGDDVRDARFHPALSWRTPAQLTFHTGDYFEGQNGAFGFRYFLLLPLTLAALYAAPHRSATLIGLGGAVVIAATQPNARYFYAALPLLTVGAGAALEWLRTSHARLMQATLAALAIAALANLWFLPASGWYHRDLYSNPMFSAAGRDAYLGRLAPVRKVVAYINRVNPTRPVFYSDSSEVAGLLAPAYRNSWHDYDTLKQVEACPRAEDVYRLLRRLGIEYMIVNLNNHDRQESLTAVISICGQPEYTLQNYSAIKLRPDCEALLRKP